MIIFKKRTLLESILNLWPPRKKREEKRTMEAIKYLIDNPAAPCVVNGYLIPHGYGEEAKLCKTLFGFDV